MRQYICRNDKKHPPAPSAPHEPPGSLCRACLRAAPAYHIHRNQPLKTACLPAQTRRESFSPSLPLSRTPYPPADHICGRYPPRSAPLSPQILPPKKLPTFPFYPLLFFLLIFFAFLFIIFLFAVLLCCFFCCFSLCCFSLCCFSFCYF